jgi:hypothetical protein
VPSLNALRETRFPKSLPRNLRMTVEQVKAVRVKAHWQHWDTMAMAQALQFELMLRQKELIGEWIPISEPGASKVTNDSERKWLMGLCWEQIDENLILRHNHSSEKGEDIKFDLKLAPMVLEEFRTPCTNPNCPANPSRATRFRPDDNLRDHRIPLLDRRVSSEVAHRRKACWRPRQHK